MNLEEPSRESNRPERVGSRSRAALFVVGWFAALGGTLAVAEIPGEPADSMCGVWGCYPPLQAVISMHLFWAVVLLGPIGLLAARKPCGLRRVGWTMAGLGVIGVAALLAIDLSQWLGTVSESAARWWPRRIQYCLLTPTDLPAAQLVLGGLLAIGFAPRVECHSTRPSGATEIAPHSAEVV